MVRLSRNCAMKLASSYTLKRIIEALIEDITFWDRLDYAQERAVLAILDEHIQELDNCGICRGCDDYVLINKMFLSFFDRFGELNAEYEDLIEKVASQFNLALPKCQLSRALMIVEGKKYITKRISLDLQAKFLAYVAEVDSVIDSLTVNYCVHQTMELNDIILNSSVAAQGSTAEYLPVSIPRQSKLVYVDQNFLGKFAALDKIRNQLLHAKTNGFTFVFSPYLVEDGIKMNPVYLREYLEDIEDLTDGTSFAFCQGDLTTVREPLPKLVDRIVRWKEVTRAAEELRVVDAAFCSAGYPLLRRKRPEIVELNRDAPAFFLKLNAGRYDKAFTRLVHALFIKDARGFDIGDMVASGIGSEDDVDCSKKIESLCLLLDKLNFCTEDDKKKIRSSYQDTQHLMHAWKADYFVTDDSNLRTRGAFIYRLLGLETNFVSSKELIDRISASFRPSESERFVG